MMFPLVHKVVRYVWHLGNVKEDKILTDEMMEVLYEDDGSHYERKTVDGVVTKIRESQGIAVIDEEIYMDLAAPVIGGRKIRLNDRLVALVKRRSEEDAWRVERVEMIDRNISWENVDAPKSDTVDAQLKIPDHFLSKIVVGQVTAVSDGSIVVSDGELSFRENKAEGLVLLKGDWVSCTVIYDPEDAQQTLECIIAAPLRQWKFEAVVTYLEGNMGIIDEDIFFQTSVCTNRYVNDIKCIFMLFKGTKILNILRPFSATLRKSETKST